MDHPTSPSLSDRPAKRQRRVSYNAEYKNKAQSHIQHSSDSVTNKAEVSYALFDSK